MASNWRGVRVELFGMRKVSDLTDAELHALCKRAAGWKYSRVADAAWRELRLRES